MSNSSELINKLEQLHKMKEEGKLSEGEYLTMKSKIMSGLTGKEIPTGVTANTKDDDNPKEKVQDEKKGDDSGLLGKLEQLHKMKGEGKLSEDEYLMMKNKVMSSLTGKLTQTKTETKISETPAQKTLSEATGPAGKLEQLHKMKEEGKLSEDEYLMMKNKVMSALTGKEIQSVKETKNISDETSNETTEIKNNIAESQIQTKATEDPGPADKIEQLLQMKERGMISEEEFVSMKNKILLTMVGSKETTQTESKKQIIDCESNSIKKENKITPQQLSNPDNKVRISRKTMYACVGIIFLTAIVFIIFTLVNKEEKNDLSGISNKFYDSKSSDITTKVEPSNSDNSKKLTQSNNHEMPNDFYGKLVYQATNGKFEKLIGSFLDEKCGEIVNYSFYFVDLNNDNILEAFQTVIGPQSCYGKEGCETYSFFRNSEGNWSKCNSWPGCFDVKMLNSINNGYNDIQLVTGNSEYYPTWKWNGSKYELLNSDFKNNASPTPDNSSNESNLVNKENSNSSRAENIVKLWIEALGKRDFESAYNLMSPSLSKSYAIFTSPNRYGGIVKTSIHSVETVSSSGCNYVVVASYDSFDPSNRDGKFTERFNVSNCDGTSQITSIKNISTEYYR